MRIQATEHKRWPAFLLDDRGHTVIGFRFHPNPETPDDDVEPFGWPDLAYRPEEFRAEFARLRTTLCRRLRELKKQVEPQGPSAVTPVLSAGDRRPRIYLHGIGDDARLRGQIEDTLTAHSFEVVSLRTEPGETLSAWGEQSRKHIAFARRCDALALIHDPMNAEFDAELLDIADDQERISRERGAALPWAVLDASGQPLPRFAVARGAERFDLNDTGWSDRLDLWLKRARGDAAAPSP